ncbi:MAG TPA: hypothetical protein GX707_07835 [Epulopiscium sp.]|nr:hypothetical protein [Candidatus Epulonipiscium sp.]
MLKKNKQLITGFILGAIIFGTMPVQAKVQEYLLQKSTAKVMVDGKEFANKALPVLSYKNSNYIPMATFREICNTIGVGFEWVGESREVQISTGKNEVAKEEKKSEISSIEKDGYKLIVVDGVEYVEPRSVSEKHLDQGYDFGFVSDTKEFYFYHANDRRSLSDKKTLLNNIPHSIFEDKGHIEYDYFKRNILPLIK